jgi:hypothetical protein
MVYGMPVGATATAADEDEDDDSGAGTRIVKTGQRVSQGIRTPRSGGHN